ncbi:MAG: hypothetical protein LBU85_03655 [Treponema sp.]|jgi:hypothetical protein|nr:hypothetical protein [Treponema sp.]
MRNEEYSLLRLVPAVLRARDFRLYTKTGRLVDLWQNNGAAVLGHTPPSLLKELKNTASRGLYAPFPHFLEARYHKALSRIFPGRAFRLYAAPPPELEKLAADGSASLWWPFADPASPLTVPENPPVLIPVLPGIQTWRGGLPLGLCVLAVKESAAIGQDGLPPGGLPPGDCLPPILLAVAVRGIYDLLSAAPARANLNYPRIAKALKNSEGQNFWQRSGIYLTPRQEPSQKEWAALFRRFLENGFLLPPHPSHPLILPGVLSPGEEAKLAALLPAIDIF